MRKYFIIILGCLFQSLYAGDYDFSLYADNGVINQSATNYGKYLFIFEDKFASITLYDLSAKEIIYTLKLVPHPERNKTSIVYHCNQCCFSKTKFHKNDSFPLLYLSQRRPNEQEGAFIDVIRIIPHITDKKQIDSFNIQKIQRIHLPKMTDKNSLGYPNIVVDSKNGVFYSYSRNNRINAENHWEAVITKFSIPDIKNNEEVYLTDEDIIDAFPLGISLYGAQGGFYRKNSIYFVQGFPTTSDPEHNYVYFREINLKQKKVKRTVDMLNNGFKMEPEGCWFYNKKVMVTNNKKEIYELTGKKYKVR
ncbi:MAG: hypothetical protein IJ693_01075 [Bacteroidaceae bacterium]|nr:hypothetical protein [Bacteroidaceae bacterium]